MCAPSPTTVSGHTKDKACIDITGEYRETAVGHDIAASIQVGADVRTGGSHRHCGFAIRRPQLGRQVVIGISADLVKIHRVAGGGATAGVNGVVADVRTQQ